MLYYLEAPHQRLVHVLSHMMGWTGVGVLDRMWQFDYLFDSMPEVVSRDKSNHTGYKIFPEFDSDKPFQLTGVRLMERAVFIGGPESEGRLLRLNDQSPGNHDLVVHWTDLSPIHIETVDESLSYMLEEWLARTSQDWHKECFR